VVKNAIGTFREFKVAYIEQPVGRTQVFDWFSKFKGSRTYAEDSECLEYLVMSKTDDLVDWVKELVVRNKFPVREVVEMSLGIWFGSVQNILKDKYEHVSDCLLSLLCLCVNCWQTRKRL
jgi:hypothetical protein